MGIGRRERSELAAFTPTKSTTSHFYAPTFPGVETRPILVPPRREERAHGQRPFAAAGGGRAGTGSRGLLGRSGDLMLVRPARRRRGRGKGFVPLRSPGAAGNGSARVPTRPEQGHLPGTLADNGCAERRASSKRYLQTHTPDGCPALRSPFQTFSGKPREAAKLCANLLPPPGEERRRRGGGKSGKGPPTPQAPT